MPDIITIDKNEYINLINSKAELDEINKQEVKQKYTLLSLSETIKITTLSKTSIYESVKKGNFPKPIKIGWGRRSAWSLQEINDYISKQMELRN
jgi:prophage regulatory protein